MIVRQDKPFSEACERNQQAILDVIQPRLKATLRLLEIGSGTGQHAVFMAQHMPWLTWQCSDLSSHHAGIEQWLNDAQLNNVKPPLNLDVSAQPWPLCETYHAIFSANAVHIMGWESVVAMFAGIGEALEEEGLLILYGPFNYNGEYTSASNAAFDQWLKANQEESGIRDFEAINSLAESQGLRLTEDIQMPANNRLLLWKKDSYSL